MPNKCLLREWTTLPPNNSMYFEVREEERVGYIFTKALCRFCILVQNAQLCSFLYMKLFEDVTYRGRDTPSSSSPSTVFISRHITYLLHYANEGTACGLECAVLCERQKEKPINTRNVDQRTFYYKTRSFLKDSKHDEFLFATEFMKIDDSLCGCFNWVCLVVWSRVANPHKYIYCHP